MSFRREKYVPAGGPDGGNGGRGGDVVIVADAAEATLSGFREKRSFRAGHGSAGEGGRRSGRDGKPLTLHVPPGTVVRNGDDLVADLDRAGASVVAAHGGRGGRGNAHFATPTRQAPRIGELGERGERVRVHLELKLIADVGLVGLPNAGKSTLLSALTGAHPKVGAYPFTTLHPNLGVAQAPSGRALIIADVPGLIEGAHRGAGLGVEFLRHVERTRVLVHVVDVAAGVDAARTAMHVVDTELREFSSEVSGRPTIIALNKIDVPEGAEAARALTRTLHANAIAAATGEGIEALLHTIDDAVPLAVASTVPAAGTHRVYRHRGRGNAAVTREGEAFRVVGDAVERMVAATDLDNDEAVARLQRSMRRSGIDDALRAAGASEGDTVRIGGAEFVFSDEAG